MLIAVDQTVEETFQVPTEPVVIRFSEFPISFTSTVLFVLVLAITAIIASLMVVTLAILRFRLGWRLPIFGH
jgi:hypothetical protein